MAWMDWNARFVLGVRDMDAQHRVLIDAMNKVYDRNAAGAPAAEVLRLVDDLAARTSKHFADEEAYMASIGFDGLQQHQIIHRRLLERLVRHRAEIAASGHADDGLFNFLKHWLSSHICGIDTKYAAASPKVAAAAR